MKLCTNCFRQIEDIVLFCPYCGYPLEPHVVVKRCSRGHIIFEEWKTCFFCTLSERADRTKVEESLPFAIENTVVEEMDATVMEGDLEKTRLDDQSDKTVVSDEALQNIFAWLVLLEEGRPLKDYRIQKEKTFLGKGSEADIILEDEFASRLHAALYYKEGGFEIDDLNSTNGTFVNGKKVDRVKLQDGDVIKIGRSEFLFKFLNLKG